MKTLLLSSLVLASVPAHAFTLDCSGFLNGSLDFIDEVSINPGQKNVAVGESGEYEFVLSALAEDKFELQGYNFNEPSRTYSIAKITKTGDVVELAVWKREFLIEVKCQAR